MTLTKNRRQDNHKFYPLDQSPLYKVKSKAQVADILKTDCKTISYLLSSHENYIRLKTEQGRDLQWPKPSLRRIQQRRLTCLAESRRPNFSIPPNEADHTSPMRPHTMRCFPR